MNMCIAYVGEGPVICIKPTKLKQYYYTLLTVTVYENGYFKKIDLAVYYPVKKGGHKCSMSGNGNMFVKEDSDYNLYIHNKTLNNINYLSRNPNSVVNIKTNKDLDENKNEIIVKVTSEDKKNKNTYKILINTRSDSEKISSKKSIFDNKNFDEVDLKIIRIAIISVILIGLGIIFYFIFIKKRPNKDLCISRNILRK